MKLRVQEGEQLNVLAVALGVSRVAFGEGDVLCGLVERGEARVDARAPGG